MTDTDKKSIEDEIALRERVLAYKKKEQELNAETWHRVLKFLVLIFTLALCGAALFLSTGCCCETEKKITALQRDVNEIRTTTETKLDAEKKHSDVKVLKQDVSSAKARIERDASAFKDEAKKLIDAISSTRIEISNIKKEILETVNGNEKKENVRCAEIEKKFTENVEKLQKLQEGINELKDLNNSKNSANVEKTDSGTVKNGVFIENAANKPPEPEKPKPEGWNRDDWNGFEKIMKIVLRTVLILAVLATAAFVASRLLRPRED